MVLARRPVVLLLLAAAVLAASLGFGLVRESTPADAAAAKTVRIDIKDYAYSKEKVTVKVGTRIVWTNRDDMRHDVTRDGKAGPKSKLLDQGKRYTWTATKAGTFTYHCSPHPFMKGTIVVKR
jgi:plastocyanin